MTSKPPLPPPPTTTMASTTTTSSGTLTLDNDPTEPDDEWKEKLRKQIEEGLVSMVSDAMASMQSKLKQAPVAPEERDRLAKEHHQTMRNIRRLAQEQFESALERERMERRWAAGQTVDRHWEEILVREQQAIMDNIKKDDGAG